MADLVVLVPALGRPHNVKPLLDSVEATCEARVLFLCDAADAAEIAAVDADPRAHIDICGGNYAYKINRGITLTSEPLIFTGADDIRFRGGWYEAAKARIAEGASVVGTQDLCNRRTIRGEHATHFLVTRSYAKGPQLDGARGLLCELYAHCCVDDELIATASAAGAYAFAEDAIVEHLHPMNGTAPDDEVYRKGIASIRADRRILRERRPLWAG